VTVQPGVPKFLERQGGVGLRLNTECYRQLRLNEEREFLRLSGHPGNSTIDWTKLTSGFRYAGTGERTVIVDVDAASRCWNAR